MPVAASTASGNFAGCAVASVIIGVVPRYSLATFTPMAEWGHKSSPVSRKAVVMVAEEGGRFAPVDVETGLETGGQTEIDMRFDTMTKMAMATTSIKI